MKQNPDCPDLFLAESTALVDLCGELVGKYIIVTWINMSNVKTNPCDIPLNPGWLIGILIVKTL